MICFEPSTLQPHGPHVQVAQTYQGDRVRNCKSCPATDAQALYLREREAELQLDFVAAEANEKKYVDGHTGQKFRAKCRTADFYHRR